jgi:hypothetical protein
MNGVANGLYGGDLPNQINTPWIDFSEQSTIVGWSSFTAKQIRYKQIGSLVYVSYIIIGTSNSTSATFTLPFVVNRNVSSLNAYGYGAVVGDNSNFVVGGFGTISGNVFTQFRYTSLTNSTSTFTASGTKQITGQFFYEI